MNTRVFTAALLFTGLVVTVAWGQPVAPVADDNVQLMGSSVRTPAAVKGDFFAVGGRIVVDQPVTTDALLFGGAVDVLAPVGGDLRAAGGDVVVEGTVGGNAHVAGGRVAFSAGARVAGRADLFGGQVVVDSPVDGSLDVRARLLRLNGPVGGDVRAAVQTLELGPQARIKGSLRHASDEFTRDPAAVVQGPVVQAEQLFERGMDWGKRHPWRGDREPGMMGRWWWWMPLAMAASGLLVLAGVVLFLFSGFATRAAGQIEATPLHALGLGTGVLVATPVLAVLLFFTVLGIPLGLVVMALYPPLLLLGWLIGALFAARWLAARASGGGQPTASAVPFGWVALTVLALLLLGAVPLLGPLLTALAMVAGLGACVLEWRRRLTRPPQGAAV